MLYRVNSTFFGSTNTNFTSAGCFLYNNEVKTAFNPTDLPWPVAPAISKCGILAKSKTKVLDIGTGGGLPGIPLAIFFPKTMFYLVDRKQKKIDVLRNIIIELDLKNVIVERIDAQDISNEYDFILNRAVSSTENILSISRNKIKTNSFNKIQNGIICLKGGNLENETVKLKNFEIMNLNKIFSEPFFETKKILYIPNPYTHMDNQ